MRSAAWGQKTSDVLPQNRVPRQSPETPARGDPKRVPRHARAARRHALVRQLVIILTEHK